jgi:predicted phosphodiesterase
MGDLLGNIPWKRFWIPRETVPPLDWQGYLANPDGDYGRIANPDARTLEDLEDTACLALLGEPGIGKSYVLDAYRARALAQDSENVLAIDCRWHHNLDHELFGTKRFKLWLGGSTPLTLILDSLDEHPLGASYVATQLLGHVTRGPLTSFRLRIACRTAEWPTVLDEQLMHLWNQIGSEARAAYYALAPLRQVDVAQAAAADAPTFLEQVAQREVQALASRPITLGFLLEEYRRNGTLPRTRDELYRSGCTILCEETSRTRGDAGRIGHLRPEQRIALAARIAAASVLCRRSLVHRGPLRGSVSPDAMRLYDLVGGTEPSPLGDVAVTAEHLDEVVKVSGLFAPRGAEYVGWAHLTYAEYLAARFLRDSGLSPESALQELSNPAMRRTVPSLRETAAWLACMDIGVFNALLGTDPESLLRSDFAMIGDTERDALVAALLLEIDERRLLVHSLQYRRDIESRLNHPRLAEQLLPYILERQHYVVARCTAIDIAERCKTDGLQSVLADRALDQDEVYEVRVAAARAVSWFGLLATKRRLRPLLCGDRSKDPDDSLKAHVLEALWPHDLSAAELFANVTPPNDENNGGPYSTFLNGLGATLTIDQLPEALRWTLTLPARHGDVLSYTLASLLEDVLLAGWNHVDVDRVRMAFAEAVRQRLASHDGVFDRPGHGSAGVDVTRDDHRRHLLASALIVLPPYGDYEAFSLAAERLILPADVPWVLDQMTSTATPPQRVRWANILSHVARHCWTFEVADAIIGALPALVELQRAMPWVFPLHVVLGSPESKQMRREVRDFRKRKGRLRYKGSTQRTGAERGPSAKRFIRHAMRRFEQGDLECAWRLQYALMASPGRASLADPERVDLTTTYGWQQATDETRARILEIARQYLVRAEDESAEWIGQNKRYYSADAGYRYLSLIDKLDPTWLEAHAGSVWPRWAAITLAFSSNAKAETQHMVAQAYRSQPHRVIDALRVLLLKQNADHGYPFAIFHMSSCWDDELGRFLLDFVQRMAGLKARFLGELLDEMLVHAAKGAASFALSLIAAPVPGEGLERERMHAAAHALMAYAPEVGWGAIQAAVQSDPAFGRELLLTFPRELHATRSRAWGLGLRPSDLANIYVWIERDFPRELDPHDRGPGFHMVTSRHMVGELRDSLMSDLSSRGTTEAVEAISHIAAVFADRDFTWSLLRAKETAAQATWTPRSPTEVVELRAAAPGRSAQRAAVVRTSSAGEANEPRSPSGKLEQLAGPSMPERLMKPLRILHISDLHERAEFPGMPDHRKAVLEVDREERGYVLGESFSDALRDLAKDGIDIVCFTGDLADWGHPQEYAAATARLELILADVGVPKDRFFAVPGNHDVQRRVQSVAWQGIRDWHAKTHETRQLGRWFRKVGAEPPGLSRSWREELLERTAAFWKWTQAFGCAYQGSSDSKLLGYRATLPSGTFAHVPVAIHIVGLDSAWLCGAEDDQGRILVTEEQVQAHIREGERPLDGFRIALVHHPLDHLADHHDVRRLLGDNGVDALLHGHQHVPVALVSDEPGARLRSFAAGCLMEGDVGKRWPNGFQLIEVDVAAMSGAVYFRKWAPNGRFWAMGSDIYRDAPEGVLRWSGVSRSTALGSSGPRSA